MREQIVRRDFEGGITDGIRWIRLEVRRIELDFQVLERGTRRSVRREELLVVFSI